MNLQRFVKYIKPILVVGDISEFLNNLGLLLFYSFRLHGLKACARNYKIIKPNEQNDWSIIWSKDRPKASDSMSLESTYLASDITVYNLYISQMIDDPVNTLDFHYVKINIFVLKLVLVYF